MLTREELKKQADVAAQAVEIELKGLGVIKIKPLTLKERIEARQAGMNVDDTLDIERFQHFVLLKCLVEPKLEVVDMAWLENMPAGTVDKIITAIYRISGMDVDEVKKK